MQLPNSFIQQIEANLGETDAFTTALTKKPIVSIRINPSKSTNVFQEMETVPWHPNAHYLETRPIFTLDPLFHAGAYYVQEASSMFLYELLKQTMDLTAPLKVLDLCAAPGGKSTLLASAISPNSLLVSNEVIRKRVEPLKQNMTKWGLTNYLLSNHDPDDFSGLKGFFDLVLVDAPCSGEGLFRKDPRAIDEWSPDHVLHCAARQKRILQAAQQLIRPGGSLIYATCTYNQQENDQNLEWLCEQEGFEKTNIVLQPAWGIHPTSMGFQCYPHLLKGEGFYAGILKKPEESRQTKFREVVRLNGLKRLSEKEGQPLKPWLEHPERFLFFQKPNFEVVAIPQASASNMLRVCQELRRRSVGLTMGVLKNKKFIPSHELALSTAISKQLPKIQLTKEEALQYLKKETFDLSSLDKGWHLIQFQGLNLGWVKMLGHRYNNYLPNEWRIRMSIK